MGDLVIAVLLVATTAAFALIGVRRSGGWHGLDDYLVARNAFDARTGAATLLATTFGAWLLFSPAEAATWGGGIALLGYGLGVAAPRVVMIPLGRRLRRAVPNGRTLPEFVRARYGPGLALAILVIMVGYLAVAIAAEATATARVIGAVSTLPAWLPAGITLAASVLYTGVGGLRASIVTDRAQMMVIVPFLVVMLAIGAWILWQAGAGEGAAAAHAVTVFPNSGRAWEFAAALFLAILFTGLLNQGNWQRVYAMESERAVARSLAWAAAIAAPVVILVGGFGLLHGMLGLDQPSAAVFAVVKTAVPAWALSAIAVLAVALVLSTMDTALNAVASLVVVALRTARPDWPAARLVRLSVAAMAAASVVALVVAMQGWSVLYLFLCADLLCAAAAVPVFAGLFLERYGSGLAMASLIVGLVAGIAVFPDPSFSGACLWDAAVAALGMPGAAVGSSLWGAFALAAGLPAVLIPLSMLAETRFDPSLLAARIRPYAD